MDDPILNKLPIATNSVASLISLTEYFAAAIGFFDMYITPGDTTNLLELFVFKYTVVCLIKICTLYLTPFEKPKQLISYRDPIVELLGQTKKAFERDLFFSGHIAFLCLLIFMNHNQIILYIKLGCLITEVVSILLSRVHYTIDIFISPFIAYTVSNLVDKICL